MFSFALGKRGQSAIELRCGATAGRLHAQTAIEQASPAAGRLSGQSATEVIVVLAVVLIIAMVSVSLLGENLDQVTGVKTSQSAAYWAMQAPVAITSWSAGAGGLTLRVKNNGNYRIRVTTVMGNNGANVSTGSSNWIEPGEETTISNIAYGSLNPTSTCTPSSKSSGSLVIPDFGFAYTQSISSGGAAVSLSKIVRSGDALPLVAECSSADVICNGAICGPSESCCALDSPNYCYATSGGGCDACGGCAVGDLCSGGVCLEACGAGYCDAGKNCCPDNICRSSCSGTLCGCFLPGTLVQTSQGKVPIEELAIGQEVLAFDGDRVLSSTIFEIYSVERDSYYEILAGISRVKATAEHPFYVGDGAFVKASQLRQGDTVYLLSSGNLVPATIDSIALIRTPVVAYNLKTAFPNTFFADGFAVHNKAGVITCYESEGEECCEAIEGEPYCAIPPSLPCDVCGGCSPKTGACCPKDITCTANGVPCKDGKIACYGDTCNPEKEVCCDLPGIRSGCVDKGMCK